jgi:hypothetical protein
LAAIVPFATSAATTAGDDDRDDNASDSDVGGVGAIQ